MRYLWQHIFTIIDQYRNAVPLHHYLKQYYRNQPKLGSRDRRGISDAIYSWYRCGKALEKDDQGREELLLAALFVCDIPTKALQKQFPETWMEYWGKPLSQRLQLLSAQHYNINLNAIFPEETFLSEGITRQEWIESILQQPRLFLRILKDKNKVEQKLREAELSFEWINEQVLALQNGAAIDKILNPDVYVIQDASSQSTGRFFAPAANENWWDCCSGAGGKSLLLRQLEPKVKLLSTDIRESILHNLKERFKLYHLAPPQTMVADAADETQTAKLLENKRFQGIIADVPCTGAGTWARTPEQLYFFDTKQLSIYTNRQETILRNALNYAETGGKLIYITCSVFRAENEDVVEKIAAESNWTIESMQLIKGISRKADCLFVAVLRK